MSYFSKFLTGSLGTPAFAALLLGIAAVPAKAGLIFTYENPGVQQTTVPGVQTENFDDNNLTSAIGTYSGGTILAAGQYGGAGGTGSYLFSSGGASTTLTLNSNQAYFGMWWSAADAGNSLSFYDDKNTLLKNYNVSDLIAVLSSGYYGNPTTNFLGQNSRQPYVYLNFTATGTDVIRSVVFSGSNFESDNHSVTKERITPPGNSVPDGGSTLMLSGMALLGVAGMRRLLGAAKANR